MSRDHRKLKAFDLSDQLTLEVYRITRVFPKEEMFGLTSQVRRSASSVPANIVEGCARKTEAEYSHFLNIAMGSLRETGYHLSLAFRLGYVPQNEADPLNELHDHACRVLSNLISSLNGRD